MTLETRVIRRLRALGYGTVSFARTLAIRGVPEKHKWWSFQATNSQQFAEESDARRNRRAYQYPSVLTVGAPTRAGAIARMAKAVDA